jgi:hypothetical protein
LIHAETRIAALQTTQGGSLLDSMTKLFGHERLRDGGVERLKLSDTLSRYRPSNVRLIRCKPDNRDGRSFELTARTVPSCEMKDDT